MDMVHAEVRTHLRDVLAPIQVLRDVRHIIHTEHDERHVQK
jgi:hypothetical protein